MEKEQTEREKILQIIREVSGDDSSKKKKKKKKTQQRRKTIETDIDLFAEDEEE